MQSKTVKLNNPKIRKMRICKRFFDRKYGKCAIFPDIRLCGRWLQDSGFKAGQYIHIAHERLKIVITLAPKENDITPANNEKK